MFGNLRGTELLLLLLIIVLIFGAKKLPETARGLGRSLRIFKAETKGLREDDSETRPVDTTQAQQADGTAPRPVEPRQIASGAEVNEPRPAHRPAETVSERESFER